MGARLREGRRVLAPGSPVVFVTPNVGTLTVGADSFWLDPGHGRPIPAELFRFLLEVEGYEEVQLVTFAPYEGAKLDESGDGAANARLLNAVLFGDRDYAVIGHAPYVESASA